MNTSIDETCSFSQSLFCKRKPTPDILTEVKKKKAKQKQQTNIPFSPTGSWPLYVPSGHTPLTRH